MFMTHSQQHDKAFSLDNIKTLINNGSFWKYYNVEYSPGDGHCFMYSVKSSLKSQLCLDISIEDLSRLITCKSLSNRDYYLHCIYRNSVYNLMKELSDYIERKLYKSWFGDIVPTITANALNIGIIVIEKRNNGFECYNVGKNANNSNSIPLILLKNGEQYDGLTIIHNQIYERHVIEYVMNGNACTTGQNTVFATDDVSETSSTFMTPCSQLQHMPTSDDHVNHESSFP